MRAAAALRLEVFVVEQGVPEEEEIDAFDLPGAPAVHALVREGDAAIGTGRYVARDEHAVRIGRMAVANARRGRGIGRAVLDALAREARRRGFASAHLHAQIHARDFYRKAGFVDDGEPLWDAGILHQPMSVRLEDYGAA